jgi:hypothetical protein
LTLQRYILEVGIEAIPQGDITAVIDIYRWLDEHTFADLAKVLLEHLLPVCDE